MSVLSDSILLRDFLKIPFYGRLSIFSLNTKKFLDLDSLDDDEMNIALEMPIVRFYSCIDHGISALRVEIGD